MFIKKTWHFQSNFAWHIHVYWVGLISIMQIIVKYSKLYKNNRCRNSIKIPGRNVTNLDFESKELKSTWLSNREMIKKLCPDGLQRADKSEERPEGWVKCPERTETAVVSMTAWRRWPVQITEEQPAFQLPSGKWETREAAVNMESGPQHESAPVHLPLKA